jgi:translation initiation factor 2B subunit (eIF-2B alpha/beta/delta family)
MKKIEKIKLNNILSDNTSGSTEIVYNLNNWVKNNINDPSAIKEMIVIASQKLQTFEAANNYLKDLKSSLKEDERTIKDFVNNYFKQTENQYLKIYKNFVPYTKDIKRIFALSNSKTLFKVFKLINKKSKLSVAIAESRPQSEGRILAKTLLKEGIKVEFIPDVLMPAAIEKADAVVIGADIILANGDVVNKIGSKAAAILTKHFNKPFYVLASKNKFSRKKKYIPEFKQQSELWNFPHKNLIRINYYFEVVEKKYITRLITD